MMKALFTDFLSVSLSGSLILCLVFLIRLVFRKAPKAVICILWAAAFLRLLLPFQIQTSLSLRPDTPVFSVAAPSFQEQQSEEIVQITNNQIGLPTQAIPDNGIDGWKIASLIWIVGVAAMLGYALVSYFLLKRHLADAPYDDAGFYVSNKISSAILLGYFHPEIYLPEAVDPEQAELVFSHELAHLRRGDNWLKLFGFIALAVHWYNPLVWVAYILLCRDVEDACDAFVVSDLDAEGKKRYSAALLACSMEKRSFSVCPVAFGEISTRQRILNVLHYRKPTLWISILAIIVIVVAMVFFMTDPKQEHPPYFETLSNSIGKSAEEVCNVLGIAPEDLTISGDRGYICDTPVCVSYCGISFRLRFYIAQYSDDYCPMYSFEYYAIYDAEDSKLEKDVVNLSRHLWDSFGQGDPSVSRKEPELLSYISKKTVRRTVNEHVIHGVHTGILTEFWDVTKDVSAGGKKNLDALSQFRKIIITESPAKELETPLTISYSGALHLNYNVRCGMIYDSKYENRDKICVSLEYLARAEIQKVPIYVATYIEKQTWWDKVWNWLK